jgi:hypothetical protein
MYEKHDCLPFLVVNEYSLYLEVTRIRREEDSFIKEDIDRTMYK